MNQEEEEFTLDAQAILDEAPDYKTGIDTLLETYQGSQFNDPAQAQTILSNYGSRLGSKFDAHYYNDVMAKELLPIPLEEVEAEDPLMRINQWQKMNEDEIKNSKDPDTLIMKDRLLNTAKRAAISERRKLNGKDSLEDFEARQVTDIKDESFGGMLYRKTLGGFLPNVSGLFGSGRNEEYYEAEDPNKSTAEHLAGDVAGGAGFVAQIGAGAGIGAAVSGPAAPIGATVGAGVVLAVNAASAIKRAFQSSEEITGSTERATGAAAIEGVSQAAQAAIGGKAVVGAGRRIIGKTLGTLSKEALAAGGAGLLTGATGGSLSTIANQVGTDDYSAINIVKNTAKGALVGTIIGSGAGAGLHIVGSALRPPADTHSSNTNTIKNTEFPDNIPNPDTQLEAKVQSNDGVSQKSPAQNETAMPYDATANVSEEVAKKIDILKDSLNPEGEPIKIYSDNEGKLVVEDPYVDENLELQDTPQTAGKVIVKSEGDVLVGANKPRVNEDGSTNYNSKVLGKSAGAAHIEEIGKERGFAEKVRLDPRIDSEMKEYFGDKEGPGISRYLPDTNLEQTSEAQATINEKGLQGATTELLSTPKDQISVKQQALGKEIVRQLFQTYQNAKRDGNVEAAGQALKLWSDASAHFDVTGTVAGQALQARVGALDDVTATADLTHVLAKEEAVKETALEDKIPVDTLKKTDTELKETHEQIDTLNKLEDPEIVKTEKDISDAEDLVKEIDTEAEQKVKVEQDVVKQKVTQAETELKDIEEKTKAKNVEAENQAKQLETQIKTTEESHAKEVEKYNTSIENNKTKVESDIKNMEEKAVKKADESKQKKVASEESVLKKLKENKAKGAKVKDETISRVEENIKKEKEHKPTIEDGLTTEEKKLYRKLKTDKEKLAASKPATAETLIPKPERVKLEKLKKLQSDYQLAKTKGQSPKDTERVNALKDFIKGQKEHAASLKPENKLGAQKSKQRLKLTSAINELKTKKESLSSKFNEANKKRYDELTKKANVLKERKNKIDKKTAQKFEERLPQDKIKRLEELVAAQKLLKEDSPSRERVQTEIDQIKHDAARTYKSKAKTLSDRLMTYFLSQMLFRLSTQGVNLGSNIGEAFIKPAAYVVTGFGKGRSITDGARWLGAFGKELFSTGFKEGLEVFKTGRETIKPKVGTSKGDLVIKEPSKNSFKLETDEEGNLSVKSPTNFEDPVHAIRQIPVVGKFLAPLGYALRALGAGDAIFTRSGITAEAHVLAAVEGRKQGLSGNALAKFIGEKLFNTETDKNNALTQARNEAEVLEKVGIKTSENDIVSNAWSIMEKQRANDIRVASTYGSGLSFFSNDTIPRGFAGTLFNHLSSLFTKAIPLPGGKFITNPLKILQPFTSTMFKVANVAIDATPVGFLKAASGKFLFNEPSNVIRTQLGAAMVGSSIMAIATGALRANGNAPNPWFDVTAGVPRDPNERAKFYASKKLPWSIKLGNGYYSFQNSPLLGPLGAVAMLNDRKKNDKNYQESDYMQTAGILMAGSFHAFADLNVFKTTNDLINAIATGEDKGDALKNSLASITKNALIPYNAVIAEITRSYDNPITTRNNFWAKVLNNTPLASMVGRPALNMFGEPVKKDWYESIPFVSSLTGRFVGIESNDPDTLWLSNNGYRPLGIENKVTLGSKDAKYDWVKMSRAERFGLAFDDVLTDEQQYKLQQVVGPQYREVISKYRSIYGDAKFDQKIQDKLTDELSKIKSREKYRMFVESAQ